jgi:hypothetical protein
MAIVIEGKTIEPTRNCSHYEFTPGRVKLWEVVDIKVGRNPDKEIYRMIAKAAAKYSRG